MKRDTERKRLSRIRKLVAKLASMPSFKFDGTAAMGSQALDVWEEIAGECGLGHRDEKAGDDEIASDLDRFAGDIPGRGPSIHRPAERVKPSRPHYDGPYQSNPIREAITDETEAAR